ncbi:MAG: hypothetical protein WCX28_04725 [Bacteriovoracaceae bacterium]|nr:hypothetical protein [Bacteroidota bacterium]
MEAKQSKQIIVNTALAVSGMIVWIVISMITEKDEPWDADLFWSYGTFSMLGINAIAAFVDPHGIIPKGMISVSLQPVALMFVAGEIGSMFPLGVIVFGILGLLYSIGGLAGAFLKNQFFRSNP